MNSPFKIKDVIIANRVIVAPMAGITNMAYRSLLKQLGAGLIYSEMVSDKAINYRNKKTMDMLVIDENEHPISLQLFGSEIDSMVEAARYIDQNTLCDIIDINMGCPVNKITANNAGSALMKDPMHIFNLVSAIKANISKPLSVKIRSGYFEKAINAKEVAILCEKAGADAIAVHPRTRNQMYSGKADWNIIKVVKEVVKIPVSGNGDIINRDDAFAMMALTKCDAVMIGRGLLGNPWLIKEILDESFTTIDYDKKLDMVIEHALRLVEQKGEKVAIREMRGQAGWYLSGLPHNNKIKERLSKVVCLAEIKQIVAEYRLMLSTHQD